MNHYRVKPQYSMKFDELLVDNFAGGGERCRELVSQGALFFHNTSGGKDSQASYLHLRDIIPRDQVVLIHAHLGRVEWPGVIEHIESTTDHEFHIANAIYRDGKGKDFLSMVEKKFQDRPEVPSWPSPANRQCTSDLKRGPIQKVIRRIMKERGATIAVNVDGRRKQESSARAKLVEWDEDAGLSKAGRTVYGWRPILEWTEEEVFARIAAAGQEPHWAYAAGNKRLSCMFCIMGCKTDLQNAALDLMPGEVDGPDSVVVPREFMSRIGEMPCWCYNASQPLKCLACEAKAILTASQSAQGSEVEG